VATNAIIPSVNLQTEINASQAKISSVSLQSEVNGTSVKLSKVNLQVELAEFPYLDTLDATSITGTAATLNGIFYSGISAVTEMGFVYAKTSNPTTANSKKVITTSSGTLSGAIIELEALTTYHVRAFVTDSVGTYYGDDVTFNTLTNGVSASVTGTVGNSDAEGLVASITLTSRDVEVPSLNLQVETTITQVETVSINLQTEIIIPEVAISDVSLQVEVLLPDVIAILKKYVNGAWVPYPLKKYNTSSWNDYPVKKYNGTWE
jgi:hypothetical protein